MACHSIGLALRALPTNSPVQSSEQAPIYVITLFKVCLYKHGLEGVESQVYYILYKWVMMVAPLFLYIPFRLDHGIISLQSRTSKCMLIYQQLR